MGKKSWLVINLSWLVQRCSPCRNIGGEVCTVVGVHQLGCSGDVLPLSWCCATWHTTTTLCHSCPDNWGNRCLHTHFCNTFWVVGTSKKLKQITKSLFRKQSLQASYHFWFISKCPTNDTAEEAQAGGVALPSIPRTLPPGWWQRDAQPDWTVEFASAWLDGNHRAEGRLVTKLPSQQLIRDWLRLRKKYWEKRLSKGRMSEQTVQRTWS